MKDVAQRNEQFENIARLKAEFVAMQQPIISMDTKKKELLGDFYRAGSVYAQAPLEAYDHDFPSFAQGKVIPHGIYDLTHNLGFLTLGNSHDTAEFACDSLRLWWQHQGQVLYPNAHSLLILCDGGGSNSSRHYVFKQALQALANELGITIRIAHYPPYTSKYNPIDHRLFPHVTRACQGVLFHTLEQVKSLMERTQTQQGLSVLVHILDQFYETGKKVPDAFKANMPIQFDDFLPQWNYCAIPSA
jgi:hypothetical protein